MKSKTVEEQALESIEDNIEEAQSPENAGDLPWGDPSGADLIETERFESDRSETAQILRWPDKETQFPGVETYSEQALKFFFGTGIRPGTADSKESLSLHPAALHQYLDTDRFRNPWPLVLSTGPSGAIVSTLPELIDRTLDNLTGDGDSKEIKRRAIFQLEKRLRDTAANSDPVPVTRVLDDVTSILLDSVNGKADRLEEYKAAFALFNQNLVGDEILLPLGISSAVVLLERFSVASLQDRVGSFREEIDWLNGRLADLLLVESEDSTEGVTPERLEHTVGGAFQDEFNFGSLSHLLEDAPHGPALAPERKKRILGIREDFETAIQLLYETHDNPATSDISEAVTRSDTRSEAFTRLVRAMQMARVEVENRYRPERHDKIFKEFSASSIEPSLLELRPPVVLHLSANEASERHSEFSALLDHEWPVRCLITVDRIVNNECRITGNAFVGFATLARGDRYVGQTSLASSSVLASLIAESTATRESSVVVVFTGSDETHPDLSSYLRSALSTDTRAFPAFRYRPLTDSDWIDRFSATDNEQTEETWPIEDLHIEGSSEVAPVCVTASDFLFTDQRLENQFLPISLATEYAGLTELESYLNSPFPDRDTQIPYVLLADEHGNLVRAVVSQRVVGIVTSVRDRWRIVQEWSGIRSSIAERETSALRAELEEAHKRDLDSARQAFEQQLNESAESIARQVVDNIAAGLLGATQFSGGSFASAVGPSAAPGPTSAPPKERTEIDVATPTDAVDTVVEPEEDEDEPLSFDDPYIDTPLCTTCNECTDLNGLIFAYNENKQATIKDASAGTFRELVLAAEKCPVRIIHPGKPTNPKEPNLEEWVERARPFL